MERTLLFFIALVAGTQAGPIQEIAIGNNCATKCTVSRKFNYERGTTYEFKYENEIRTAVQGASEDHAGLTMSATVNIDFITKCEAVMRLSEVVMKEHDPETSQMKVVSAELKALLEKDPVSFSFQDGHIEQICLADEQDVKVLNIKRGILSMLQNKMDDLSQPQTVSESDVAGTCDTDYSSTDKGWYNVVVTKSKHMLSCTDRHDSITAIQGIPYDSQSKIQSLPLVKSTHSCEQELVKSSGKLVSATCREQHVLAPFSRESSGAITHNTQHLTFVRESSTNSEPVASTITSSLHFDHSTPNKLTNTVKDLQEKLTEICVNTRKGVQPETPRLFTSLVYIMKKMEAADMATVYQKISSKAFCGENNDRVRKFFLDALPVTGTKASLNMMTNLLVKQEVTGIEADMWLTTLAFIQEPSVDMLNEVKPLLTMKTNEEKAMLSVSSLVHSLCRNNPDCENYLEVRKIIALMENKVAPACKVTSSTMQSTLIALRAIGNAGFGTSAIPTLSKCILKSDNPIEIRLSAIEAFRRIPCKSDKSTIMGIFTSTEEDSEVRIAAYKALMECPSTEVLRKVKTVLSQEEVNQVGSYVWSHLTNLMETSDPHKQGIKAILQDETLQKEFDMDKRKYSRNYEGSIFVEKINTGATVDGDLIWSSKSFIPRSAMANLTVDLFGNAVNIFEIGGRIEGLEYFLESYFGPNGYFSENDVQAAVDETAVQTIKADKANRINKRMNTAMADLRGSLYMRVFGNELRYMNFQGVNSLLSNSLNVLDMLMKLSQEKDYQFSHSSMFIDSSVIIPTYSGFPMNLTVNGMATLDLQASGKVDVMKVSSRPRGMDIHGLIKPSAALEVTSTMSVDALVTKVGLKMVSSMFTSTVMKGKVSLVDGSILDMELDLPEEKMEILNVKSSFFTVHRDLEREQKMITDNKQSSEICTGTTLAKIAGIELCGALSFPNASLVEEAPYFPLTGPVSASVILNKRDTLTGYKLEARSTHTTESNILRLAFSTPNSKIDRTFGIGINLNKNDGTLDMSVESPMKKAYFAGNYQFNKKSIGISGKVNIDNSLRYEVKAGVDSESSGPGMLYTPSLSVKVPGQEPVDFSGTIKYAPWKLTDVDMTLSGLVKPPVKLQASFINKMKLMRLTASASMGKKEEYSFDASCQKTAFKKKVAYKPQLSVRTPTAEVLSFGGSFTHTFGKNIIISATLDKIISDPIVLKKAIFSVKQLSKGRMRYNANLNLDSSPMVLKLKSKFDNRNMILLATDIDFTYVIRKVARDNIKLASKVTNLSSKSLTKVKSTMDFTSRQHPDYSFKAVTDLDHNKRHSQLDSKFSYGPDAKDISKQINVFVSLDKAIRNWSKASVEFNGQFIKGNDIRFVSKLKHDHDEKSLESSVNVRLNKNAVTSSLSLRDMSTNLMQLSGQFELSLPGKTITLSQTINETRPSDFISVMDARFGKAKSSIKTTWKRTSPLSLAVKADLDLYNTENMVIEGDYDFSPKLFKIAGSFVKGASRYSTSSVVQLDVGRSIQLSTDIEYPDRRIVANVEQTRGNGFYTTRADLRWNADKDDSQRLVFKMKGKIDGINNIDVFLSIQYPARNIAINLKHFYGTKYASLFHIQWEPNELYSVETVFGKYNRKESQEIEGQLKLSTPLKALKDLDVKINHQILSSEYKTQLDIEWNPKQIVSTTVTIKKPIAMGYLDAEVVAKTPFAQAKHLQASLRHRTSKGTATVAKFEWNKQYAQVDLTLDNLSNHNQRDIKAEISIKSSLHTIDTATLSLTHFCDGSKMEDSMLFKQKKQQYGFTSSMKHNVNGWNVKNTGEINIFMLSDNVKINWEHSDSLNDISSFAKITWGGYKQVTVKYSGLQRFQEGSGSLSSALEIQTSFRDLKNVIAQLTHEHRHGQIDSILKVMKDGTVLVSAEGKYLRQNGQVKSSMTISNPFSGTNMEVKLDTTYSSQPKRVKLEINLTPMQQITIDGSFNSDTSKNIDSYLAISSPSFDTVMLKGTRMSTREGIKSEASLKYSSNKEIRIQSLHRLGNNKLLQITFTSPYTTDYTVEFGMTGPSNNFQARGSIEALPYIKKWTATGSFNKLSGMTLKVTTPFPEVAYSQISISSEEENGDRKSSLTIEYMPGEIIDFISVYNFQNPRNLKLSMVLTTPFDQVPKSVLEFSHRGTLARFADHLLVEYFPGNRMTIDSTFSSDNGIDGSVVIISPWTTSLKGMIKHSGSLNNFNTHGEFTWGETKAFDVKHKGSFSAFSSGIKVSAGEKYVSANMDYTKSSKTTSTIEIRTPIKEWETIKLSQSFEGDMKKFTHHQGIFSTKFGKYETDIAIDLTNKISGDISIQTPIQGFKHLRGSVLHEGTIKRFDTRFELQRDNENVIGEMKLTTNPAIKFVVSVQTPIAGYRLVQLQWTHEGSLDEFTSKLELQQNKASSDIEVSYSFTKKFNLDVAIRSPYVDTVKISIDHWGKPTKFTSKVRARSGNQKMSTDIQFQLNPSLNAKISVKSPFAILKNHQLSLKHTGSLNNFKCNMNYRCNGKTYIGDASFENNDKVKGDINLKGPTFRPVNMAFDLTNGNRSFKSSVQASIGKNTISANAFLNMQNGVNGNLKITSPFESLESLSAGYQHQGSLSNFKSEGELSYNKKKASGSVSFDNTKDLSVSVQIATPLKGYETIVSSMKMLKRVNDFEVLTLYKINEKSIDFKASYNINQVTTFSTTLNSQMSYLPNVDASLTYGNDKFNTRGEITCEQHKAEFDAELEKSKYGYTGTINTNMPWIDRVSVNFNHENTGESFTSGLQTTYGRASEFRLMSDIRYHSPISVEITVQTPIEGLENSQISVHHSNDDSVLRSSARLMFKSDTHEVQASLLKRPTIDGQISVKSPLMKDFDSSFTFDGTSTNFKSQIDIKYNRDSQMRTDLDLNIEGPYSGELKIISPHIRNIKASFNHEGELSKFASNGMIQSAGKKIEISLTSKFTEDPEVTFRFMTPFTRDLEITLNGNGELKNGIMASDVQYGGQSQFSANANWNLVGPLEVEIRVKTAVESLRQMVAKFTHRGSLSDFTTKGEISVEDKSVSAEVSFNPSAGNILFKAPMINDIKASFTSDLKNPAVTAHAYYGSRNIFEVDFKANLPTSIEIVLKSPFLTEDSISAAMQRTGTKVHIEFQINGQLHETDVEVAADKYAGELTIRSPMIQPIHLSVNMDKKQMYLASKAEFSYGTNAQSLEVKFDLDMHIDAFILIKTSFIPDLQISFASNSDIWNLRATSAIIYDNKKVFSMATETESTDRSAVSVNVQVLDNEARLDVTLIGHSYKEFSGNMEASINSYKVEGDVSLTTARKVEATMHTKSSLFAPISGRFSFENNREKIVSSGEVNMNSRRHAFDVECDTKDKISTKMNVNSPLIPKLSATASFGGVISNFEADSKIAVGDMESMISISFNIQTAYKGKLNLNTPFTKPVMVFFDHNGQVTNFNCLARTDYGDKTLFDADVSFSVNPLQGRAQIKTALPDYEYVSAAFDYNGDTLDFTQHAEIDISGDKTEVDISFNAGSKMESRATVKSPYFSTIDSGLEINGSLSNFESTISFAYGDDKYSMESSLEVSSAISATIKLTSPIEGYRNLVGTISHTGQFPTINSIAQLKSGRRNLALVRLESSVSNGVTGRFTAQSVLFPTVQCNIAHRANQAGLNSMAELRFNGISTSANVNLKVQPSFEGSYSLVTPWKSSSGNLNFDIDKTGMNLKAEAVIDTQTISMTVSYQDRNQKILYITFKTPFENFEQLQLDAKYTRTDKSLLAQLDVQLPSQEKIEFNVDFNGITGKAILKTPLDGFKFSSVETKYQGQFPNVLGGFDLTIFNNRFSVNGELDRASGKLSILTPFEGFENTMLDVRKNGPISNLQASVRLTVMNEEIFSSLENRFVNNNLQTKARIETPFTEDMVVDLNHIWSKNEFSNALMVSMGPKNSLNSKTTFKYNLRGIEFNTIVSTVITEISDEQELKLSFHESLPNFKVLSFAKLFGSEYSFDSSLETGTEIQGKLSLYTPFRILKSMSLTMNHKGSTERFETNADLALNSQKVTGELSFEKSGWRRILTRIDVKSTFEGFEHSTASYRHTSDDDSFECDLEASIINQDFSGNLQASKAPWKAQVTVTTPFTGYKQMVADVKLDIEDGICNAEANIAIKQDQAISFTSEVNLKGSTKTIHILLSTPFKGYETSEFRVTHTGDVMNFVSIASVSASYAPSIRAQANLRSLSLSNFEFDLVFNSQIHNLEFLKLNLKNEAGPRLYKSRIESSWSPTQTVTIESEIFDGINQASADISISSPWEMARQFSFKAESKINDNVYSNILVIKRNEKTCVDTDFEIDATKHFVKLSIRDPTPLNANIGGSVNSGKYLGHIFINDDLKIEGSHDSNTLRTAFSLDNAGHTVKINNDFNKRTPKADILIGNDRYGYEMLMTSTETDFKLVLPSRSLKLRGSHGQGKTEGMFMWDADNDKTKMVGIKSELRRLSDSVKADITLQMPSLGKNVQIDSEMVVNKGRVIFEGKTDLKYSKDSRKTITLTSRLVDISNDWNTQNYSFSLGVEHPFTTVGVHLTSHFGKSNAEMTGGVGMEYLTARRETKTFSVNGELNKVRNTARFDMQTPMKKISISGNSRLQAPFSVSLVNQYDDKHPLRTSFSLDPSSKKVDFQINYDIENPNSEFYMSAKYVNSTAILSEIAHVVNRQKVTDALLFLRLNNSHLLHSRVHWRPTIGADLKEFLVKKSTSYRNSLSQLSNNMASSLKEEYDYKSSIIQAAFQEEMRPFAEIAENLYASNAYHVRDISVAATEYSEAARERYQRFAVAAAERLQHVREVTIEMSEAAILNIEELTMRVLASAMPAFEPLYNMTQHPLVSAFRQRAYNNYVTYMDTLTSLPQSVPNMAEAYTSAIYNARDQLRSKLVSVLQRDNVKYMRTYTDPMMTQGMNAYKFWEIRQNAAMIVDTILDVVISEVEKELSDLKASLFNLKDTRVTVFDPAQGEVQLDMHLPVPVHSLQEVPVIDVAPYLSKARQYQARLPRLPRISADVSSWLPPFDAYAKIQGDHVTTFDGSEYDLDGSCSFLLAKDFVDGNFSLVLHKDDNSKSLLIMADGRAITILPDGKVLVDKMAIATPIVLRNIEISSIDQATVVKGAGSFEVKFEPAADLTTVRLSGWYFGKTGGLLGTYDNEPSNDLMSSYGRPISDPARFARTWDLSLTKCR